MRRQQTTELTLLAILTALTVAFGKMLSIPTPTGMLTLLDVGIYFAAFYLGSRQGGIVGAASGFLIDLISGYPQWMLISLFAHGAQGYFGGWTGKYRWLGLFLAAVVMVGSYFVASTVMYGFGKALPEVLPNFSQNAFGLLGGYLLSLAVGKISQEKTI